MKDLGRGPAQEPAICGLEARRQQPVQRDRVVAFQDHASTRDRVFQPA